MKKQKIKIEPIQEIHEEDIYTENGIQAIYEDDEINSLEEGFMRGYLSA